MKKAVILSVAIATLLLGGFTTFYVNDKTNNITHEKKISKVKENVSPQKISKNEAKKINDAFYSHKITKAGGESCFVGEYPSTFSKMINKSELVVVGEVVGLKSHVFSSFPYITVSLRVDKVLKGNSKKLNKTIPIEIMGGNITRKEDAAAHNFKLSDDTDPNEIITLEFTRLPRAGEKMAVGLTKIPKGVNGTQGKSWSATYVEKSTFFQDSDGKYRRESEVPPITDKDTRDLTGQKEDELMNNGMNDLINKSQNKNKLNNASIQDKSITLYPIPSCCSFHFAQ